LSALKHIIWDWNGTLLDDTWLCIELINGLLKRHSLPSLDREAHRQQFDFPIQEYYARLGFDFDKVIFADLARDFFAAYDARWEACKLQPYTREALAEARANGLSGSVLSAARQSTLEHNLRHHKLDCLFRGLVGQEDHEARGKLERGRDWIAQLPWNPDEILLIGDTLHDQEVANTLGCRCALVSNGHQHPRRLEHCGAPVYENLESLVQAEL
jgi:phosphoglycolate phosphatase